MDIFSQTSNDHKIIEFAWSLKHINQMSQVLNICTIKPLDFQSPSYFFIEIRDTKKLCIYWRTPSSLCSHFSLTKQAYSVLLVNVIHIAGIW